MSDALERLNAALGGRYTIERELGEGGMATVYLAKDLKHNREVALKVLKPELAAVVGAERFLAEIEVTANLTHPHILPLHDSGEADSFLFYVMPYVQGESLRERIDREKQLGVDDALAITQKVAGALDYAHGHGVVHRDIKPGNILLSEQGEPLVADFGIALAVAQAGAGRITETGLSLGTPHYMSPEQATGDRDVDPQSDVYALGCVLYEMLSGDPPFLASTAQAVLVKILTSDAPPITTVRGTVPHNIERRFLGLWRSFRRTVLGRPLSFRRRSQTTTSSIQPDLPLLMWDLAQIPLRSLPLDRSPCRSLWSVLWQSSRWLLPRGVGFGPQRRLLAATASRYLRDGACPISSVRTSRSLPMAPVSFSPLPPRELARASSFG